MHIKHLFTVISITAVMACNNSSENRANGYSDTPKTKIDSLEKDVIDGHDVGMAKLGALKKYGRQLQEKIDSLSKKAKTAADSGLQEALVTTKSALKDAEESMNKWMEEYRPDSALNDLKQRTRYFEDEKARVNVVKEKILNSLKQADSLLKKSID